MILLRWVARTTSLSGLPMIIRPPPESGATEAGTAVEAGGAGAGVLDFGGAALGAGEAVAEADDEFARVGLDGGAVEAVMRDVGRVFVHGGGGGGVV